MLKHIIEGIILLGINHMEFYVNDKRVHNLFTFLFNWVLPFVLGYYWFVVP